MQICRVFACMFTMLGIIMLRRLSHHQAERALHPPSLPAVTVTAAVTACYRGGSSSSSSTQGACCLDAIRGIPLLPPAHPVLPWMYLGWGLPITLNPQTHNVVTTSKLTRIAFPVEADRQLPSLASSRGRFPPYMCDSGPMTLLE